MISLFNYPHPHLLERATSIIDLFTQNAAQPWLTLDKEELASTVSGIFAENDPGFKLILSRCVYDRNLCTFFLYLKRKKATAFLRYYDIPLNSMYDEIQVALSEIEGKSEWNTNPFEIQVVRHYADWCLRGDIGVIIDLETSFYERMKNAGINPLAKGNEWHKTWIILDDREKHYLMNNILSYYFRYISGQPA